MVKITDDESLYKWLNARPPGPKDTRGADASLIAARAALRVAPLLVGALGNDVVNRRAAILLPAFRAMAVASHAGTWPQQATEVAAASRAASHDTAAASHDTAAAAAVLAVVRAAVVIRAPVAVHAASRTASHDTATSAVRATSRAAAAITRATADDPTFAAVSLDATALENGQDHAAIANFPLWPQGTPDWVTDHWTRLSGPGHLSSAEARAEGWDVWIKWYQARLDGDWIRPWSSALERDIVLIDDDAWNQGPDVVNARIAGLIDDHAIRNTPLAAKLTVDPDTGRFSVETHEVAEGGDYWVALKKIADRVEALRRGCQGENWFGAIEPILDDLERVMKERAGIPAFVHDRFQTALLNIETWQNIGELPKAEMRIDNLARDLDMGVMDIRIAFPEVERKARARAHLRMERLPQSRREDIRGVVDEIVAEGMTEPLLGEHLKGEAETLVDAPDAPSPEGGLPEGPEKSAGYELGGWLLRMYRKATDRAWLKERIKDASGMIEGLIKVGTLIEKVLSWIRSLLGFFGSF